MNKQKEWRPRIRENQVSLRRQGKFIVVVCKTFDEGDLVERYILKALAISRGRPWFLIGKAMGGL